MVDSPPLVIAEDIQQVASGVHVIPDRRVEFVPNAGVLVGNRATLVIDTAMGRRNGQTILDAAHRLGGQKKLLLTTTHFHPEHAFGAQPFAEATYVCNASQAQELADKGQEYIEMFSGFGPGLAELLSDAQLVAPDITYSSGRAEVDLGGLVAQLIEIGPAHTRGDQVIFLPETKVLFAGDLVEDRFLPIFPDEDAIGSRWLDALDRLEQLEPAIVVGGHGEVGDVSLIHALRDYLTTVRDRVAELHGEGWPLEAIEERLEPELGERHAGWDNQMWIKSAVDSFHAALAR
jgi:glyoxylase-like metal-dependent hydrolase (beta-lactamase superfamily II)